MDSMPSANPSSLGVLAYEKKLIFVWSLTVTLVVMNTTMFNVSLPSVISDLGLDSINASWIVSGYSVVFAISTLTYSRLSDYLPIKRLLIIGLALLGMSSFIGLFAHTFELLLTARFLQAAGAGAVPALAFVLTARYIPIVRRGRAMAYISSAASVGFGLGPVFGGLITHYLGWNYLFAVTGLVMLMLPLFHYLLPIEQATKIAFDFMGSILTAITVTSLLLFISTFSFYYLIGSIVFLVILWRRIHYYPSPFIQPDLFKNRQYVKLLLMAMSVFMTHFAALFLMPIILSVQFDKDSAMIGMIIFPGAILSAIAAHFIGRFIDLLGNRPILLVGHILLLISTVSFAVLSSMTPYAILFSYIFMSIGFSAIVSSVSNEISRLLTPEQLGAGMGIIQLNQFFGGALGASLAGVLLAMQDNFIPAVSYRNIFLGLTFLIVCSCYTLYLYSRKK